MASTTRCAVPKSERLSSSEKVPSPPTGASTVRSTSAPAGMRPELSWLICTLLPLAEAPAPPTTMLPCAMA